MQFRIESEVLEVYCTASTNGPQTENRNNSACLLKNSTWFACLAEDTRIGGCHSSSPIAKTSRTTKDIWI